MKFIYVFFSFSFRTSFNQFTGLNFSVADFTTVTQSFAELKKSFFEMTDSVGNAVTTILEPIFNALGIDTTNNVSILNAFKMTDDILRQGIQSITDLINSVGTIKCIEVVYYA